ncbi:unnamed protein product [Linum tenue]|uniref:Late embryogenesis abundant protein LEA-2 subgroup domain-containing protein n=1 Tax=Linum tenue TaxID=586396 RepID=A0AAV0R014_9ROSI|nr:unnamed protein product [Linum tenue]
MAATSKSTLRVCCISATIVALVTISVLVTLALTVFKPRDPDVVLYPVGLAKLQLSDFITNDSVTSDMVMSIRNKNYASFEFQNATSHIKYDGKLVGRVPIVQGTIPARSTFNITAPAVLRAKRLRENPNAINDIVGGSLNLTATVTMHGKVSMLNRLIKKKGSVYTECHMTIYMSEVPIRGESWCWAKLEM